MISLIAATIVLGLQDLPAGIKIAKQNEYRLTQSFFEIEDGARAEQHEFRLETDVEVANGKSVLTEKRWLSGWVIGDIRLDDPVKPTPVIRRYELNSDGTIDTTKLKDFEVAEYRIDRLRWFFYPEMAMGPNSNWNSINPAIPSIQLPEIEYHFRLQTVSAEDGAFLAKIVCEAKETNTSEPLSAKGIIRVRIVGNTLRLESGEWTTPKAPMLGGTDERFKMVQIVLPPAK